MDITSQYPPSPNDVRFHGQWPLRRRERLLQQLKLRGGPSDPRDELSLHLCQVCLDLIPPGEASRLLAQLVYSPLQSTLGLSGAAAFLSGM